MMWHHDNKSKLGTMRHPADGSAWQSFDKTHGDFASDPHNVKTRIS